MPTKDKNDEQCCICCSNEPEQEPGIQNNLENADASTLQDLKTLLQEQEHFQPWEHPEETKRIL